MPLEELHFVFEVKHFAKGGEVGGGVRLGEFGIGEGTLGHPNKANLAVLNIIYHISSSSLASSSANAMRGLMW